MSTTATNQGVRCGNHGKDRVYHNTSADVRACFQSPNPISSRPAASSQPVDLVEMRQGVKAFNGPRNADEARSEAMQRLANQTSPFFQDRMPRAYPASEKQINFLKDLIAELLVAEAQGAAYAKVEAGISGAEAKLMITNLLELRKANAKKPQADIPSSRLSLINQVMGKREERNFAIIDGEGKARFYRFSKRGKQSRRPGTWKIQERVTDMLLPRADAMLATVAQAIIDQGGAEAAGRRFAELLRKCYECGTSLTDTTGNPYYAFGLGPECGAK